MAPDPRNRVERWNTDPGALSGTDVVVSDANGNVRLPFADLKDDFAVKIAPAPAERR